MKVCAQSGQRRADICMLCTRLFDKEGYGLLESGSPVNHCHEGLSCGFSAGNGAHARAAALGRELRARAARWNRRGSRLLVARQGCVLARAALVAMFDMALAARRLLHRHGE